MSWEDNLREAAYISPLGFRITFLYEDVSRNLGRKTTGFEFPAMNGTQVQDLGTTGKKYPLRLFFSGPDCDVQALRFEAEVQESGVGRLEHPMYGIVNVIPYGSINRRDDLKTKANQAVIELVFWETIIEIYAGSITALADLVFQGIDLYNAAASGQLNTEIVLDKFIETSAFKNFYSRLTNSLVNRLNDVVKTSTSVSTAFKQISQSILKSLSSDAAPDVPTLASQTTSLVQVPGNAVEASVDDRLTSYGEYITPLIADVPTPSPHDNRVGNDFFTSDFFAATSITAMVLSVTQAEFTSKTDALFAADAILSTFDVYVAWREASYIALDKEDTGRLYQELQELVVGTVGYLVQLSFTLQQEFRLVTTEPKSMIALVGELYGTVDDKIDFFINSNNLTGSEILEIPKGREIVYYV